MLKHKTRNHNRNRPMGTGHCGGHRVLTTLLIAPSSEFPRPLDLLTPTYSDPEGSNSRARDLCMDNHTLFHSTLAMVMSLENKPNVLELGWGSAIYRYATPAMIFSPLS